ncbi:glycosyltransferase family 2 protein [bacterium]|nr:glycosyltransferase family 2 protein [bacterium]
MKKKIDISVVIPVYGCDETLIELYSQLTDILRGIVKSYEIIFIDDCAGENSWEIIKKISANDSFASGLKLSRNFGQHAAISAGIDRSRGDYTVVMDCDLQDNPKEIINFYNESRKGYHIVVGRRKNRQDGFFVKLTSKMFYKVFNYFSEQKINYEIANYGIYSRDAINAVKKYKEKDRSFGLLMTLVGFSRTEIDIKHLRRASGVSSYNFRSRINMAIGHILSHSNKPLLLAVKVGFVCTFGAIIYSIWLIISFLNSGSPPDGWTSIIVSMFFLSGLILSVIGVVGIYIGKIYNEVKDRPLYIIDKFSKEDNGK